MLQSLLASHPIRCGHRRRCLVLDVIEVDSGSQESPLVFRSGICIKWSSLLTDADYCQALRKTWKILCQEHGWKGREVMAGGTLRWGPVSSTLPTRASSLTRTHGWIGCYPQSSGGQTKLCLYLSVSIFLPNWAPWLL